MCHSATLMHYIPTIVHLSPKNNRPLDHFLRTIPRNNSCVFEVSFFCRLEEFDIRGRDLSASPFFFRQAKLSCLKSCASTPVPLAPLWRLLNTVVPVVQDI